MNKDGLKQKLETYLQEIGGIVPYNQVRRMVEEVWESPKGGHYRMETLTRRGRKDNKLVESNEHIGKTYNESGVITGFFYKKNAEQVLDSLIMGTVKEFCCLENWHGQQHNPKCYKLKVVTLPTPQGRK